MNTFLFKSLLLLAGLTGLLACAGSKKATTFAKDPLGEILTTLNRRDTLMHRVLSQANTYEIQIIYTQIDRDAAGNPHFTAYRYGVDSTRYFYPASMVKMPLALLSLEKINNLRRSGYPKLTRNTPYTLDSLRAFQQEYKTDTTAPGGKPSIAHDVRQIFVVSDNLAYNHTFEFLGRQYINEALYNKGYTRTGIVHRFNYPGRDNRYTSPIAFGDKSGSIFKEDERFDPNEWKNPQHSTVKGRGYFNAKDSLVLQPFEMGRKNWFALTDMEKMIRAVMFPKSVPEENRFRITDDDYRFVWKYMSIFPRECDYPRYNSASYYDGYVKFFMFGDGKAQQDGKIRVFNKVGEAYGTLTDAAYIVDFEHNVEFILAATILCNPDGIFNDDKYDYEQTGFPFLAKLGRAVHQHELQRKRTNIPDLSIFKKIHD
jgi:hypothetical protein